MQPGPEPTIHAASGSSHVVLWTSLATAGAAVVITIGASLLSLDDPVGHLVSHLAFALPGLALVVIAWKMWPAPVGDRYGRVIRNIVLGALGVAGVGQLFEGIGAFGYDGNDRVNGLAGLHDVALVVSTLGLLALMFGIGLAVLFAFTRRLGWIESRWMLAVVGLAAAGVIAFVLGGFIFGY